MSLILKSSSTQSGQIIRLFVAVEGKSQLNTENYSIWFKAQRSLLRTGIKSPYLEKLELNFE